MRILFLPGQYPFCYYYRGFLPGVYSNQMVVKDFIVRQPSIEATIEQAKEADVVVFQRPNEPKSLELAKALKQRGAKIIFENDDTYQNLPLERLENDKQRDLAKELGQKLKAFLALADGAIASTELLAKEYAEINPNVVVLKNCIDPLDEFPVKPNTTGKFRIGFIGSVTGNDDYIHIKDQIRQLDDRGVTIVVLGVKYKDGRYALLTEKDYKFWGSLKNIELHPYVLVTEYMSYLASLALDLAVIPREESYFNRCKSNLKFLEMSLLGIPVIAQGFSDGTSPYEGVDKPYLTIVSDNSQWYNKITEIEYNHPTYKALANKAREYVLTNYNIESYAPKWIEGINSLISKK